MNQTLQTIKLTEIKASTPRVRITQDAEKLDELAASIKEEGILSPVKVRANGHGYTAIFGHRRIAAAKMAGLTEIPAIVESVDDDALLTQALTENVIRESMAAIDIAKALQTIIDETGCTQAVLGKRMGWADHRAVGRYLNMLEPELDLLKGPARGVSAHHVDEAKAGTDGDLKLAGKVLAKAAKEELSTRETRMVADAARRAQRVSGSKGVEQVLRMPKGDIERYTKTDKTVVPTGKKAKVAAARSAGKIVFQWLQSPLYSMADHGLEAIAKCIAAIVNSDEDLGGGKAVLKDLRSKMAKLITQIDKVLK